MKKAFAPVDPKQNFPTLEKKILAHWKKNKIFEQSVKNRPASKEYVFYDGPPFATGLPHYGHLLAGTMKDVVPRYWTMRGKRVERRFGWDCHGLPIEYEVEKELGLNGRKDIEEKYGVAKFSEKCRSVVTRYTKEWREAVERMGRWVDMDNDYKTMDPEFMESIWWVFGQLWEKGLVYQGHKSMHICPRCVTPLSNFEVTLGYKEVTDTSVVVKFKIEGKKNKNGKDTYIVAWTTTPWTLPGNMALAVGKEIEYFKFDDRETGETLIASKEYFRKIEAKEPTRYKQKDIVKGRDLIGLKYEPLFNFYKNSEGADKLWKIFYGDFVSTEEGTGVVHVAGGFGEDDMNLSQKNKLPILLHVAMDGTFKEEVTLWAGKFVKTQDKAIVEHLKNCGLLLSEEPYRHSYPHCWRCDSPLLNYATTSWFVNIEKIKQKMVKANAKVHWVPDHVGTGRFNDWLENARDWCISRNRYWGTPLPLWRSTDEKGNGEFLCIKSIKELEKLTGKKVTDLHKHKIDSLEIKIKPKGSKTAKIYTRIPEVFDCWFESGAMPYAQMHYPFENKGKFEANFPAEYIAEGLDQTRGWFYTLVVLGTALYGTSPFKNVVVNGLILAEDGKKMSKRLKNYPDPMLVFDKYGADALRFYLMNSPAVKAEPLCFSERGVENVVKNVILPLWNAYSFFVTYANIDGWTPPKPSATSKPSKKSNKLDRWILSELHTLIKEVTTEMDAYNLQAIRPMVQFIDHLTNWYIRRSRRRFWKSTDDRDKKEGYETLYTVLVTLSQIIAPVMPFLAEAIYQNLAGSHSRSSSPSVHLTDWPKANPRTIDRKLNQEVELAQKIATLGNAARARSKVKNRQPLAKAQIGLPEALRHAFPLDQQEVIREELNVKELAVVEDPSRIAKPVVQPNPKILGPKYGKDVQFILAEARVGNFEILESGNLKIGQFELSPEEFNLGYQSGEGMDVESDAGIVVALDTRLTPELKAEGLARDLIRTIQDMRKEAGYKVEDRIEVGVEVLNPEKPEGQALLTALDLFKEMIAKETLATKFGSKALPAADLEKEVEGGRVGVRKL